MIDEYQWLEPCFCPQTSIDVSRTARDFVATVLRRTNRTWRRNEAKESAGADRQDHRSDEARRDVAYRVPDLRCKGLALRVATDGGKTWDLRYRIKGEGVRRPSLGRYEDVGLEAARRRANELTSAARQGRDLIAEEEAARDEYNQSFTVERLIGEYVRTPRDRAAQNSRRDRTQAQTRARANDEPQSRRHPPPRSPPTARRRRRSRIGRAKPDNDGRPSARCSNGPWPRTSSKAIPADGLGSYGLGTPRDRVLSEDEIQPAVAMARR